MSKIFKRTLFTLLSVLILIAIGGSIALPALARRSFPQTSGEIQLPGLDGPVDVYRDSFGIPHIYATTSHDLFMAQGYVQAQDRFWQMDMWRHQATGRLSEVLGSNTLEIDKYLQTLGWERVAQREVELLDADSLGILNAFSEGVNAYLSSHSGSELSLEYAFLNLINSGYEPPPWKPIHSLAWAKAMAWDLRGNMDTELDRARLMASLTPEQMSTLYPPYDYENHPIIVNHPHLTGGAALPERDPALAGLPAPYLDAVADMFASLDSLRGGGFEGIGSNSWVVSGDLTDTGMPYLSNDPHLSAQLPSIWYEVGLHCVPKSEACPYEVTGFAFSSIPGVVIGHNDRIAWGMTNVGPDVMDLYIEKINPANPNQYEVNGEWVDMELVPVTINVAGSDPVEITVRYTRHGPILTDISLEDFADEAGIDLPENFAIALRWTALTPNFTFRAIWKTNHAQNWEEFRAAVRDFAVPSQNLVYADVDGNIGYQTPGDIPIRNPGHDGLLPVPGWTDDFEWQGLIPFEDLPFAFNPPEGYIVTANNAVVGPDYPYVLSRRWDFGYRAQAIVDMIESAPGPIDIPYLQKMQGSNLDLNAEQLVPVLMQAPLSGQRLIDVRAMLDGWDFQAGMDSAPAALFEVFWKHLLEATFRDDLPEFFWPGGNSGWIRVVGDMLATPNHPWWDDQNTPEIEDRDQIFALAFEAAVTELDQSLGRNYEAWTWGDLHTLTFEHIVMNSFPLINRLFNEGPFRTSGGSSIVNATGWSARSDSATYAVRSLPSMRMIVDFSALQNSLTMHTTGQSGHATQSHYIDMADPWRLIEYHPMLWDGQNIQEAAESHLRFLP